MKALNPTRLLRPILAMLPPLVASILQSMFWPALRPYVWFLFYPAVFFSSWIGGLPSGLMATAISTALVWWFFIPPEYSFMMKNPQSFLSAAVFMGMGVLFSLFHGRLRKANKRTAEALAVVSSVNDQLETRVRERTVDLARSNELLRAEVAQRKRAGEKMRLQSSALESAANAIVITDRDGIIIWVNPAFTKFTGYSPEEGIGQNLRLLKSGIQDQPFYENLWNTILSGEVWSGEMVNRRKDGALYTEEQTITPVRNNQGEVTHFIAIKQDITERKRMEEQILKLNRDLEQRVIERTAQLEAANKELEAFSYSVSHDLRAPLRAIEGFSRILLEDYLPQIPPDAQRHLQLVCANTRQMGELIDDLLAFSRLSRQPLRKQPVALGDLINQVLEDLRTGQQEKSLEITVGDLPDCEADPAMLKQVLVNLLSNAVKFTRKREAPRIEVGCRQREAECVYFVKDNGAGFDTRYADKLFGVFQRLHRAEEYEGTGVGLAIVQRVIHRHGGKVWAESGIDQGATFYFTLKGGPSDG